MKTVYTALLISLLLLVSGCAKVNDPADVQAIKTTLIDFAKAVNAKDSNAAVAMMTDKTYYADVNMPPAIGKDAIRKAMQGWNDQFGQFNIEFTTPIDDVQTSGDLAAARGTWTMKMTDKTGLLAPLKDSGSWAVTCRRQSDASWKWDTVTVSSSQSLPGTTANGADEKALLQIEQDMPIALVKGDMAAMDRMLAKEWAYNFGGQVQNKAQAMAEMKTAYKLTSVTQKDISMHIFGDFAIVTMTGEMKGTYKGKDASGALEGVDMFVRRDGRWQAVYSQNTPIKP